MRQVLHEVVVHVVVDDVPPTPLTAELRYDRADPYAVRLSVGAPGPDAVHWVFARSLLAEGVRRPAGAGDVLVSPHRRDRRSWVRVVVRSRAGAAVLEIAAPAVTAFLSRTGRLVPPGTEGQHIDLEGVIADLMAQRD
ncbi:SsgA family sporulation/cell division regulator [Streptomyces sp. NPDC005012]|uniref:SsgA family sporulation/cell division regulator n=1 Tax=Streptomyces sp. NPDC005012 TaxID=3154558 RepID=UPI0033B5A8FA